MRKQEIILIKVLLWGQNLMKRKNYTTFAAIHLGSEMISMQITEYRNTDRYKVIERCNRRIRLGEATFKNKIIPFKLVSEICEILQGFKLLMEEYGVEEYKMQATTAVREASNQIFLLDQIYNKTGLIVDVVDMPMEIYTKYVAIRNTLKNEKLSSEREGMLMMDISSGGLGVTLVRDEKIAYQENFHVGIIRTKESFERNRRESMHFNKALTEFLSSTIGPVRNELGDERVQYLVLSGTETELLLRMLGLDEEQLVHRIKAEKFHAFFDNMRQMNLPQLIQAYNIPESTAELVLPTVLLYEQLLHLIPAQEIIITADRFIDGMQLLHIGRKTNEAMRKAWEQELISLFHTIGKRYLYDRKHAQQVERLSLIIFDKIAKSYGMGENERLLLRAACILHDIGKYICMRSHSIYSYQLIMSTDIIGLSNNDKRIVALASYYHANRLFDKTKPNAPLVPENMIAVVAKLAAIVRLADALDRSYMQKIHSCTVTVRDNKLKLQAVSKDDLALEIWTFTDKAAFFEEVYGMEPVLERVNK